RPRARSRSPGGWRATGPSSAGAPRGWWPTPRAGGCSCRGLLVCGDDGLEPVDDVLAQPCGLLDHDIRSVAGDLGGDGGRVAVLEVDAVPLGVDGGHAAGATPQ